MRIRVDRTGVLIEQLSDAVMFARQRLDGMDDAEFQWEPTPNSWSIRPRAEAVSPDPIGPGSTVLDHESARDPFAPGPVSTIAWRVGHLVAGFAGRWEWTFGDRATPPGDLVEFDTAAAPMLERLWIEIDRWLIAVDQLSDAEMDTVGLGQYPHGLDPQLPFIGIVRWMNREAIHHLAEAALLRDLYPTRLDAVAT